MLLTLLLVHWNLLPLPLLYLSDYFESHRSEYYDLLLAVSIQGAWREWLLFFLRGAAERAQDAVTRAKQLQDLQLAWRQQLLQARSSALSLRLADSLFESPLLTIPQAKNILNATYPSAKRSIERLIEANILQPLNDSTAYGKVFCASEILRIIGEAESTG